jgi:hypothetical protein
MIDTSRLYRFVFLPVLLFMVVSTQAQVNKQGFSASANIGGNLGFTDVKGSDVNLTYGGGVNYFISPFMGIKAEFNHGRLSRKLADRNFKAYINNYNYLTSTVNVALGQLLKPNEKVAHYMLYNIYMGTGIGVIASNISEPNSFTPDNLGGITYKGTDFTLPVNLGVDFKFLGFYYSKSPLSFNLNYQHSFAFTEMLDGYDPPNDNNTKDSFGNLSFGLKYQFYQKK